MEKHHRSHLSAVFYCEMRMWHFDLGNCKATWRQTTTRTHTHTYGWLGKYCSSFCTTLLKPFFSKLSHNNRNFSISAVQSLCRHSARKSARTLCWRSWCKRRGLCFLSFNQKSRAIFMRSIHQFQALLFVAHWHSVNVDSIMLRRVCII